MMVEGTFKIIKAQIICPMCKHKRITDGERYGRCLKCGREYKLVGDLKVDFLDTAYIIKI